MNDEKVLRAPIKDSCFFDLCDSINTHLDEGHDLAESIVGAVVKESEEAIGKPPDGTENSVGLLNSKLHRAVARAASLIAQIQRIGSSF